MFPVSSDRILAIRDIAEYWSREIRPPASPRELREEMMKAWWLGELTSAAGPERVEVLRSLQTSAVQDWMLFVTADDNRHPIAEPLPDGGAIIDVRLRVPPPPGSPNSWTEESCEEAWSAIAAEWNEGVVGALALGLVA